MAFFIEFQYDRIGVVSVDRSAFLDGWHICDGGDITEQKTGFEVGIEIAAVFEGVNTICAVCLDQRNVFQKVF